MSLEAAALQKDTPSLGALSLVTRCRCYRRVLRVLLEEARRDFRDDSSCSWFTLPEELLEGFVAIKGRTGESYLRLEYAVLLVETFLVEVPGFARFSYKWGSTGPFSGELWEAVTALRSQKDDPREEYDSLVGQLKDTWMEVLREINETVATCLTLGTFKAAKILALATHAFWECAGIGQSAENSYVLGTLKSWRFGEKEAAHALAVTWPSRMFILGYRESRAQVSVSPSCEGCPHLARSLSATAAKEACV